MKSFTSSVFKYWLVCANLHSEPSYEFYRTIRQHEHGRHEHVRYEHDGHEHEYVHVGNRGGLWNGQ